MGQEEIPTSAKTYGATQWLELRGVLCAIEVKIIVLNVSEINNYC